MSRLARQGALMVCGTTSNAGKSTVVAGLCRVLARQGVRVAPFKAQNMALNSAVTPSGHEIGRAQAAQAAAAGVEPEVEMNPILLKPTGEHTSQVIVHGRPVGEMSAAAYQDAKIELLPLVLQSLDELRGRYDVVICEGAGSPAEINLLDRDLVNLRLAHRARIPAVVVGDIDLGGVFAALFGTVMLLPDQLRPLVRGFVINKLRGDPTLLGDALDDLERRCGVPTLGVLPWVDIPAIDAEDSLALRERPRRHSPTAGDVLDVAVTELPRISNFTDLDPLALEPGVSVRFVRDGAGLGRPDLVVIPGSKATMADLDWLRSSGLAAAITASDAVILGICGGFQMLGRRIIDGVESVNASGDGLGLMPVETRFEAGKVTRHRTGKALGQTVHGYEIHHGRVRGGRDQLLERAGQIFGTNVHGLFEADGFRVAFLEEVGRIVGKRFCPGGVLFEDERQARFDLLADVLEANLELDRVGALIESATRAEVVG